MKEESLTKDEVQVDNKKKKIEYAINVEEPPTKKNKVIEEVTRKFTFFLLYVFLL